MQLLTNALLGTDKMALEIAVLPPIIAEYLQKNTAESAETAFLRAATLLIAYQKAGNEAPKLQIPDYKPAPEEMRPTCPSHFLTHFKHEKDAAPSVLLPYTIDKCLQNNWSIPASGLADLLNLGKNKDLPSGLKTKIIALAGEKGAWLAQFNPEWSYAMQQASADEMAEMLWSEGTVEQRSGVLEKHRSADADAGLAMLEATWKECSPREKKAFLRVLSLHLNKNDEPFLNQVYADILAQKENDKGLKGELKKLVVDLLLRLPNSQKQVAVFKKLTTYFTKKTGLLGFGKGEFVLKLPEAEDDFFNKKVMNLELGRTAMNNAPDIYSDAESWFQQLVCYIPPQKWADFLQKNAADTVLFFKEKLKSSVKKSHSFAFSALGHAILEQEGSPQKDTAMAFHYLMVCKTTRSKTYAPSPEVELFKLLPINELEVILKNNDVEIILNTLDSCFPKEDWGMETSNFVILKMAKAISDSYYYNNAKPQLASILPYLHPNTVFFVQNYINTQEKEYQKTKLTELLLEPMRYFFEQKRLIEAAN